MNKRIICYNNLWKLLIDRKMTQTEFRREVKIAYSTFAKLKNDEVVAMDILLKICNYLDCNVGDIVDFVKTRDDANDVGAGETE